jgi:hypothetical protein
MKAVKIWTKQEDDILREVVAAQSCRYISVALLEYSGTA